MLAFWIMPIKQKRVVLCNFNGKGFGDNPKYIALKLLEQDNDYQLIWLVKQEDKTMPDAIMQIPYGSIKALFYLATAKYWIDNNRKDLSIIKRKKQVYIQTWHGSLSLKKIEKDAESSLNAFYLKTAKHDSKMITVMLCDSDFSYKLFSESFWYAGDVVKTGMPRLDRLFEKSNCTIREKEKIDKDALVVLYAPTFRDDLSTDAYLNDFSRLTETLEKKYDKKIYIWSRLHPNIANIVKYDFSCDNVVNMSSYPDVYDLLVEADILITDYSSLMFEFPIAEIKPVYLYITDGEQYNRDFYFNIDRLPFGIAHNEEELCDLIVNTDFEDYKKAITGLYHEINLVERGDSSENVIKKYFAKKER